MYKKCLGMRADFISNDILITVDLNISIQDPTLSLPIFLCKMKPLFHKYKGLDCF